MSYRFPLYRCLTHLSYRFQSESEAKAAPLSSLSTQSPCLGYCSPLCLHNQLRSTKQVERHLSAHRIPDVLHHHREPRPVRSMIQMTQPKVLLHNVSLLGYLPVPLNLSLRYLRSCRILTHDPLRGVGSTSRRPSSISLR